MGMTNHPKSLERVSFYGWSCPEPSKIKKLKTL